MGKFTISGGSDFIKVTLEKVFGFPDTTCFWGGYDVQARIEIKSGNFGVKSGLWISTGELHDFFQQLNHSYLSLTGDVSLNSYEGNLNLIAAFDGLGHVNITGSFSEQNEFANDLKFEFVSDQTFIRSTLCELEQIVLKYGDAKGINHTN
ncbi:MAG: hypothetical protein Q8R96_00720 [Bacteroidota bacterium]|nr:hypothetical protein [Bacteroidota bacterium]